MPSGLSRGSLTTSYLDHYCVGCFSIRRLPSAALTVSIRDAGDGEGGDADVWAAEAAAEGDRREVEVGSGASSTRVWFQAIIGQALRPLRLSVSHSSNPYPAPGRVPDVGGASGTETILLGTGCSPQAFLG